MQLDHCRATNRPAVSRSRRRSGWPLTIVLAAIMTSAACGSGGGPGRSVASVGSPSASASSSAGGGNATREAIMMKFTQCMRQHGVSDFPDPVVDSKGDPALPLSAMRGRFNDPTVKNALNACKQYQQQLRNSDDIGNQQHTHDILLNYAQCMRQNGTPNFPDPDFSSASGAGGAFRGVNQNDPAYKKADQVCRPKTLATLQND